MTSAPLTLLTSDPRELPRRRRERIGRTRPGLPTDHDNPWNRAVTMWAQAMRPRLSETEHAAYVKRVGWLAGDHADRSPWSLTHTDLASWLERQDTWALSTRRQTIVAARSFYTWAMTAGLCASSPLTGASVVPPRKPGPRRMDLPPEWREPVDEWLTWLRGSAQTESTLRTRRQHILNLAQLHADPWSLSPGDLARWLSPEDWSPATKRARRASARSFYSWAVRAGYLAESPAADLDPVRQRRALPRPTPTGVLQAALATSDERTGLAIRLAFYAGLRRAEIAGLHTRDIGETHLHIRGKGGHERLVPLHPDLAGHLRRAVTVVGDGWIFPARDPETHLTPRWIGRLVGRALGPGWTTHTIRHAFATQAYQAHRDLRAVQELLGHSKPETTARYAAVPDGARTAAVLGVSL